MQRTGRKGYAQYRIVVQDSHQTPTSGRVVAHLGNYNPHTKDITLDKERAVFYLKNGAHPSQRVSTFLKKEGVKLPAWVEVFKGKKKKPIKNVEKLRKNRPAGTEAIKAEPTEAKEETSKDEPKLPEEPKEAEEQPAKKEAENKAEDETEEAPKEVQKFQEDKPKPKKDKSDDKKSESPK